MVEGITGILQVIRDDKRWPKMYDGNWHNVVFVYDATTKTATLYRDGVQFDQKTNETILFDGNDDQVIVGGFPGSSGHR